MKTKQKTNKYRFLFQTYFSFLLNSKKLQTKHNKKPTNIASFFKRIFLFCLTPSCNIIRETEKKIRLNNLGDRSEVPEISRNWDRRKQLCLARESSTKEETLELHQGYHNLHDKTKEEEFNKDRRSKLYTADSSSK